ncbi:MAG: hypothetical protein P8R42_25030 [Candidatus Binatia bacterium]|nr:hypothetical protein [Candidatus Binatia bacterium]
MRFQRKESLVFVVLVLITLWPFVHRALVAGYDVDPWRFFGLAMYAIERPAVRVANVEVGSAGGPLRRLQLRAAADPAAARAAVGATMRSRQAYGDLAPLEGEAAALLSAVPADRVRFTLEKYGLDAQGMRSATAIRFECAAKPAGGAACESQ